MDRYKQAIYDWEDSWKGWDRSTLSLVRCRSIINAACRRYGVTTPTVKTHKVGLSWSQDDVISLELKGGMNAPICLHEAAHFIVDNFCGDRTQHHGPTFLSVYVELLVHFKIASKKKIDETLQKFDLKVKPCRLAPVKRSAK